MAVIIPVHPSSKPFNNLDSDPGRIEKLSISKFSKRLLLSIFNKKSPLHDGAVIIHGEKVIAARCILPVSENENLPMNFGMRHRAAYAISEDTDALAIVISEEHNTLSLFLNGNIKKNLTSVKLRSHIVEYLDGDYNKKLN